MSGGQVNVSFSTGQTHRILTLLSREHAELIGRLVLAEERIKNGRESCTSEQWKRACKAKRALPEQIDEVEAMLTELRRGMYVARALGEIA